MGYYVTTTNARVKILKDNFEKAYKTMCDLNTTHDHLKTGGSWSAGKQTAKWFSWMDANYPETCKNMQTVLEALGFDLLFDPNTGDLTELFYDNKTGAEDVFIESIAPFIENGSFMEWRGEDGAQYRWEFRDGKMYTRNAVISWE